MTAMTMNNALSMTRGEVSQIEREAAERKLLRAIQSRKRLEAMKEQLPECRPGADFGDPQRVQWHLDNWKSWMDAGEGLTGSVAVAVGLTDGGVSKRFDDMVQSADRRCALVMHEIIHALPDAQRMAVLIDAGQLPNVFRFREPLAVKLEQAKASIGVSLQAKGVW